MLRDPNDARNEAEDEPMIGCAQLSLRLGKLGRVLRRYPKLTHLRP
jgi:hypothetical protein